MPDDRPDTASPTKVVKMKNAPAAKPERPRPLPKLVASSSPGPASKPPAEARSATEPPERMSSEPATEPIVQGTKVASPAPPPPRPPASAPRVSSPLVLPNALDDRSGTIDTAASKRAAGKASHGDEATELVKPLPLLLLEGADAVSTSTVGPGRRRQSALGKWLVGGTVAAGALVVALVAGAFDRPSGSGGAAASPPGEPSSPREEPPRAEEDSQLRIPSEPPRTVGNSPPAAAADAPSTQASSKTASEPPPGPPTPPVVAKEQPTTQVPSTTKAPPAAKPGRSHAKAVKPAGAATKPAQRNAPATKPTTPPKWDPDSLFPK